MSLQEFDLTAVFTVVENGWVQARIRELPGVITVAPTREEVGDLLIDALREYLLAGRSDDEPEPGDIADVRIAIGL